MDKTIFLTTKLLSKEVTEKNQAAIEIVASYSKAANIIERTYLAMGKKSTFKVSTSSTINEKLNTNVFASTY
jgi:hypothetical protein